MANIFIDCVIEIAVDDDEIVKRLSGRRVHPASGRVYHVLYNPPRLENKDNETGELLIQRDDDKEETIRKRLQIYHDQTKLLINYYQNWSNNGIAAPHYRQINGHHTVNEVRDEIFNFLDQLKGEESKQHA